MKLTFTILSVAGLVAAQNYGSSSSSTSASATSASTSASATPSATSSPDIPSNITSGCSNFFFALNSATTVQNCVEPALNALASNNTASMSSVCTAATSSSCSDSMIRTWLTDFRGNCTTELVTNPNSQVIAKYDVLYAFRPFLAAVCAKDVTGQFCINQSAGNSTAQTTGGMANAAQTPLTNSDGTPNAQAFSSAAILFLGASPSMNSTTLCTSCTKSVLTNYIQFESTTPPATPIQNLPLLSQQIALWAAVQKTCPANFITGTIANAGASPNVINGASTSSPAKTVIMMLAIIAASVMTL